MDKTLIEQYIEDNGEFVAIPVGTSMWPLLRNRRDTVHLVKYTGNLKKYDIALYKRETGEQVLHRCLGANCEGYIMCGDNQTYKEFAVKENQIIAVAKGIYRDEKYISTNNIFYNILIRLWCMNLKVRGRVLRELKRTTAWQKVSSEVLKEKTERQEK